MKKQSTIKNNLTKGQKLTFLLLGLFVIIAIFYSVVTLISRAGKIRTDIYFAPYSAEVTLNGTKIKNKSTSYITPGDYELEVKFDHFESIKKQVTIDNDHNKLLGTLSASDDEGKTYLEKHKMEFTEVEGRVGVYLNEEGLRTKEKYPILNHLPFNSSLYSISYDYEEEGSRPVINIKSKDIYLDAAINKLKTYGKDDDLTAYKIFFSGNDNPYLAPVASTASDPQVFINESYPSGENSKLVGEGQEIGEYYVTTIQEYNFDQDLLLAHYRIVLKKQGNTWQIVEYPQPYLTTHNMPGVPKEVIVAGNQL